MNLFTGVIASPRRYCVPKHQTIITEVGTVPTTAAFIMPPGSNALSLYTTHQSGALPGFKDVHYFVYVQVGSGPVQKIQMYWMNKFIIQAKGGQSIKISSDQARTFKVAPHTHPMSLVTPSGFTGTCPTDKAASAFWNPSAGHLLLPDYNKTFTITATGSRQPVYIQEFDGTSWSTPYTYIIEPTRNLTIQATCKRIALGTTSGIDLSITAPAGSVIDGESKDERITIPAITGTSRVVTAGSESDLRAKMALAVSGDEIVLPDGTYNLTANITASTFAANVATGKKGAEGIIIRSQSGIPANCTIKPQLNGWTIDNSTATQASYLVNLNFDMTAGASIDFASGKWRWKGGGAVGVYAADISAGNGNHITIRLNDAGNPIDFICLDLIATDASGDIFNGAGNEVYPANTAASSVNLINCQALRCGGKANSQCLTTHGGLAICAEGGLYSDSFGDAIANQQTTVAPFSITYLVHLIVSAGTRSGGAQQTAAYGCMLENVNNAMSGTITDSTMYTMFSYVKWAPASSFQTAARNVPAPCHHNIFERISGTGTRGIFWSTDADKTFIGNIVINFNEGFSHNSFPTSPAATCTQRLIGNTIVGCTTAISGGDLNATLWLTNNATKGSTSSLTGVPTGGAKYNSGGGNVLDPTVDSDFIPLSSDRKTVDASLDSNYIPISGGNCDNTGVDIGYIGGRDPYGRTWIYGTTKVPSGARSLPYIDFLIAETF